MKVHEYREMMRYLTRRPAPSNPLLEASDEGQEYVTGDRIGFKYGSINNKEKENITKKIQEFKDSLKGRGFNIQIESANHPSKNARIRVTHKKQINLVPTKQNVTRAPFTEEGLQKIISDVNKAKEDIDTYPPPSREAATEIRLSFKDQKQKWTQEAVDFINEETKNPLYHNDTYAVEKIEKKLLDKFSDPKYKQIPQGVRPQDAFVRKGGTTARIDTSSTRIFFERDFVFKEGSGLDGVKIGERVQTAGPRFQKDLIAINLLRNSNEATRWRNLSNSLTVFFNPPAEGEKKALLSEANKNELKRFSKKFKIKALSSAGATLLSNYLVNQGANFEKYKLQSVFVRRTMDELKDDLKKLDLTDQQKVTIQKTIDEIKVYEDNYKRKLYEEYPSVFKRAKGGQGLVFEHLIARSIVEQTGDLFKSIERLPYEYKLKGRYVPLAFNFAKLKNFDRPFLDLIDQYENAADIETRKATQIEIEKLYKDFNKNTKIKGGKGYLDNLKITFKPNEVILKDFTPIVGAKPLSQEQFFIDAVEGIEYSNSYFRNKGQKNNIISGPEYEKFKLSTLKKDIKNIPAMKVFAASILPAMIGSQYLPEALRDLGLIDRTYEQTAGIGDMPIKEIGPSFAEQATAGVATAGTALGASKGLFGKFAEQGAKGVGKILGATFSLPTRLTGLDRMAMKKIGFLPEDQTLAETYDPTTTAGRIGLELEATALGAYKPIAESLSSGIKNKTAQTVARNILSLGPTARFLARAARVTTPLGLASLAGEGVFYLGKKYLEEKKRRDALTPEQRREEDLERETETSRLAETGQFATEEDDLDIPLLPKSNSTTKEGILNLRSDEEDD